MKNLNMFLEEQENEAHKKAQAMGLEYRGFGYWADPNTGEIVKRSSGDELNDVGGLEAQEGPGEEEAPAPKGQSFDGMMGAAAPEVQQGEVKPGEEKAPESKDWKPGPDGDTDVGKNVDEDDLRMMRSSPRMKTLISGLLVLTVTTSRPSSLSTRCRKQRVKQLVRARVNPRFPILRHQRQT